MEMDCGADAAIRNNRRYELHKASHSNSRFRGA